MNKTLNTYVLHSSKYKYFNVGRESNMIDAVKATSKRLKPIDLFAADNRTLINIVIRNK